MKIYGPPRGSLFFSKRLIVLIAVVAFHALIAGSFISELDARARSGTLRGPNSIPIPVAPSGELIPI